MLRFSLAGLQSDGDAELASLMEPICARILALYQGEQDAELRESARELAANIWTAYGRVLLMNLDPGRAEQALDQAQKLWLDVSGKQGLLGRAQLAHWFARIERIHGSDAGALSVLRDANSMLSGALEGMVQDTDLRIELAMNELEQANDLRTALDYEGALSAQGRGLELFRQLEAERPRVEHFYAKRLGANYAYADLMLLAGRRDEGLLELAKVTAEHDARPLSGRLRGQLEYERAVASYHAGTWHMAQGDVEAAGALLQRAYADLDRAGELSRPSERELLAGLHQLEGLLLEVRGEPGRALESYSQAEALLAELCSAAPAQEHWNLMLARARHARVNICIDQGRREEAQALLGLACRELAVASSLAENSERLVQELFNYRFDRAAVLGHLQRPNESADELDLAVSELPVGAFLQDRYAAAQLYAQLVPMATALDEDALVRRLVESSVELLRPLCASGALGVEVLEGDGAFDAIRQAEPFLELLQEH